MARTPPRRVKRSASLSTSDDAQSPPRNKPRSDRVAGDSQPDSEAPQHDNASIPQHDSEDPHPEAWDCDVPELITGPIVKLIHEDLAHVKWTASPGRDMCFIFDDLVPCRLWEVGTEYTDEDPWAEDTSTHSAELTDTDDPEHPKKPYLPEEYK